MEEIETVEVRRLHPQLVYEVEYSLKLMPKLLQKQEVDFYSKEGLMHEIQFVVVLDSSSFFFLENLVHQNI
jgi:hypothetical protein